MRWKCSVLVTLATVCWSERLSAQAGRGEPPGALVRSTGSDPDRLADVPVYVISATEAHWQRTREVLASVHLTAERAHPSKPSLRLAQEVYSVSPHGKDVNLSDTVTRREVSLLSTWDRLLRFIMTDADMADDDFACVFEDDVALHGNVSHAAARRAILHGMDLARADGLLYLGSCGPRCEDGPLDRLDGIEFKRCSNLCSHAIAVTKRKAATLMDDIRVATEALFGVRNNGRAFDQMLRMYAEHNTYIWTVGSNLWSMQSVREDAGGPGGRLMGLFYQDKSHRVTH